MTTVIKQLANYLNTHSVVIIGSVFAMFFGAQALNVLVKKGLGAFLITIFIYAVAFHFLGPLLFKKR